MTEATHRWYNENASEYATRTKSLDLFPGLQLDLERFSSWLRPRSKIVDLGSGGGRDSEFLSREGHKVICLDRSSQLLGECLQRNPDRSKVSGIIADLQALPLKDQSTEGAWASGSLLHLERSDIPAAISEIYRVLMPGGKVGLSMKEGKAQEIREDGRRFTYVGKGELERWLMLSGFAVQNIMGPDRNGWLLAMASKP